MLSAHLGRPGGEKVDDRDLGGESVHPRGAQRGGGSI
jgi:hypothetical protein